MGYVREPFATGKVLLAFYFIHVHVFIQSFFKTLLWGKEKNQPIVKSSKTPLLCQ